MMFSRSAYPYPPIHAFYSRSHALLLHKKKHRQKMPKIRVETSSSTSTPYSSSSSVSARREITIELQHQIWVHVCVRYTNTPRYTNLMIRLLYVWGSSSANLCARSMCLRYGKRHLGNSFCLSPLPLQIQRKKEIFFSRKFFWNFGLWDESKI